MPNKAKVKCRLCKGTGEVEEPFEPIRCDPPQMITCPACKGTGEVNEGDQDPF